MTNNRERAAKVIDRLRSKGKGSYLIAADLDAAGLLAPDLPTDNTGELGSGEWSAGFEWEGETHAGMTEIKYAFASAWSPGHISATAPRIMTTDQAEGLALALLAAVKADREYHANNTKENK